MGGMMKKTVLAIGLLMVTVACSRKQDAQDQCVRNMQMLWEACRSYHLSEGISPTQAIDPRSLSAYFRPQDQDMRCPLGMKAYAAFSFQDGPKCPNSDTHTQILKTGAKAE
jgi:hypothetical protein